MSVRVQAAAATFVRCTFRDHDACSDSNETVAAGPAAGLEHDDDNPSSAPSVA